MKKFINVKFSQEGYFGIKPFEYKLTDEEKPSKKDLENDLRENLKNTDFGEDAIEKVLNGEIVENGLGGFVYANTDESGYDLFVCEDCLSEGVNVIMNHTYLYDADSMKTIVLYTCQGDFFMKLTGGDGYQIIFDEALPDCAGLAGVDPEKARKVVDSLYDVGGTGDISLCGGNEYLNVSLDYVRQGCYATVGPFADGMIEEKIVF
jgi:hypothetical protein